MAKVKSKSKAVTVKYGNDPFNGHVLLLEDQTQTGPNRFWAEHQRKAIVTKSMSRKAAEEKFDEFVNDAMY